MLKDSFDKLKQNLELPQTLITSISQKHNAVRSVLENKAPHIKTKLIGSFQRKTRIHPGNNNDLDIDILVILGEFTGWTTQGVTPDQASTHVHSVLNSSQRYSALAPFIDQPTVSFSYSDNIKVEFVPAYLDQIGFNSAGVHHYVTGRSYWIAKNGQWVLADYDHEADTVTRLNQETYGWFIPTVKMLKALRRIYFPAMSAYHLEIVASKVLPVLVESFKSLGVPISYPLLIEDFFQYGKDHLYQPVAFYGSTTPPVQLGQSDTITVAATFDKIVQYCKSIRAMTDTQAHASWQKLFKDHFPSL